MFCLLLHDQVISRTVFLSEGSEKVHVAGEFCVLSEVKVAQLCLTLCDPMGYTAHGILQARILEWVAFPFSWRSSQPWDQTQVSHIAVRSFTSWATGKPKSTGVGRLSLLQRIFPTQESNQGLLHCRRILYQLSYLLNLAKGFLRIAKIFFNYINNF